MSDQRIRQLLNDGVDGLPTPDISSGVWDRAQRVRRNRRLAGGSAVVIGVASIVVVAFLLARPAATSNPPPTSSTHSVRGDSAQSIRSWVESLPQGAAPVVPYVLGNTFHDGEATWSLRGYPYHVLGRAPGGWLVVQGRNGYTFRYGVLTTAGDVSWLTPALFDPMVVSSSDGDRLTVVVGGHVRLYDVAQRRQIGRLTVGPYVEPIALTDAGLIYSDTRGRHHIWSPGHAPQRMRFAPNAVSDDLRYAITIATGSPCSQAVRVSDGAVTSVVYSGCQGDRPVSLSPAGAHALTAQLSVVDMTTGAVTSLAGFPGTREWLANSIVWEDESHVLVKLAESGSYGQAPDTTALVRCSIAAFSCQRVFADVDDPPGLAVLDPSTTPW